jgi:hypothetical protein
VRFQVSDTSTTAGQLAATHITERNVAWITEHKPQTNRF